MAILLASIVGTLLGLALASGGIGKKVSDGLFISARKACKLEAPAILKADLKKVPPNADSAKI